VRLKLTSSSGRYSLRITDLASHQVSELDPADALRRAQPDPGTRDPAMLEITIDRAANGPRLKISDGQLGTCAYLDPLELSDAAVTGAWAKLPPAYDTAGTQSADLGQAL